ncbi:glycerophosphodiester phosphodiesterase family protein [Enterococcus faecium]
MAHVIKKGSIKVPTQPKDYDLQATGLVFKSYDNQIALEFNVEQQDGKPADLLGANLRLLMFIYDEVDGIIKKEPIPFITKNLITESFLNGHVVYILPEAMKAYNGMVEAYVYIEYPDGSTSDNLGFTFRMKRSAIDGLAQDKADYFIADFQQLLDGVKQEATDAVNEALAKVEAVSKNVSSAQNDLTILEDRIDQTNQQIGDLGKLKKMYSNSIDFGDYDYSGNPNLIPPISFASLGRVEDKTDTNIPGVTDGGSYFEVNTEVSLASSVSSVFVPFQPRLQPNKTYTLTVSLEYDQAFIDSGASHSITYGAKIKGVIERPVTIIGAKTTTAKQTISKTFTTSAIYGNGQAESFYQLWFATTSKGKIKVYYDFKLEEGSKATPYQPNLLDDPYWLGKAPLGDNLMTGTFPVSNSQYAILGRVLKKNLEIGETYTATLKGTKPTTQTFAAYSGGTVKFGDFKPVEGLTDVWSVTFTVSNLSNSPANFTLYQQPQATIGACQIDWLKIEKGDTRTPNIEQYKYRGTGMRNSNNPKDYAWDLAPEYVEDNLATDVKISEITGKANNYTDEKVAIVNKNLSDISADLNKQVANNKNNISTNTTAISTLQNKNLFTQNKSAHGLTWIAHRGNNSTAPENSIVAFENVYRHQAIETDIQLTSDNRWVVMHDETVDRTTNGTGKISDMTYDQFRALRIDTGANIDKLTDDEKIPPNLEEFLLICKKNNRIPVVEIKATGGYTKEQLQSIKTISDGIGMTEKTIFISFNYDMLVLMREIFPFNELQWVYQGTINTDVITKLKTLGLPCGLDINENNASLTKDNVNLLHANRLKIGAWTVGYNSFEKMKDLGIDYITTNSPSGYLKYAELSLLNGFTPTNDNGQVSQFAAELEGGYVFLSFNVKDGTNNNQLTEIAKLPDWAIPHEKQYNQCMIRTSSGVSLATFDTQGWKHSTGVTEGTITIGLGWSSRTTWAAGQCIYKID